MNHDSVRDKETMAIQSRRAERKRRAIVVVACSILILLTDIWLSFWLMRWVSRQEWSTTVYGDVGYALSFIMVFFTFAASLALIAYFFSRSSYPSDRWQ